MNLEQTLIRVTDRQTDAPQGCCWLPSLKFFLAINLLAYFFCSDDRAFVGYILVASRSDIYQLHSDRFLVWMCLFFCWLVNPHPVVRGLQGLRRDESRHFT